MTLTARFLTRPSPAEMPRSADVVIVGGGPAGTATLWALHRLDPTLRPVLIEAGGQLGSGANNASLENFRTCWPTPCLAAQMRRSIEVFLNADEYLGEGAAAAIGVKRQGYLYCAFTESGAAAYRADVDGLHANGLTHVQFLDAAQVQAEFGWLGPRLIAAKYDPMAGWLDSHALINRFAAAAPNARFILECESVRVQVAGDKVIGVWTPYGEIATPRVLIAAGANSRAVGRTAGIDIPIVVRPRQSFTTPYRHADYPADGPCVIAAAPFPHLRPEAREGAVFGYEYGWHNKAVRPPDHPPADHLTDPVWPVERAKDPRFPSITLALLAHQFGHAEGYGFADPRYLRGIHHRVGYYVSRDEQAAHTPDGRPYDSQRAIIDRWPEIEGLILSVAHVGHGIMSSPAAGEIAAAHLLGLPLPNPLYADFGLRATYVPGDTGGLSAERPA